MEISFGLAVGAVVFSVTLLPAPRFLKREFPLPRPIRAILGVSTAGGLGVFTSTEFWNLAFADTGVPTYLNNFNYVAGSLHVSPQMAAIGGLAIASISMGLLRARYGFLSGLKWAMALCLLSITVTQTALMVFDFKEATIYAIHIEPFAGWFLTGPHTYWTSLQPELGVPVGVPLLSNLFILVLSGTSLLALAMTSFKSSTLLRGLPRKS